MTNNKIIQNHKLILIGIIFSLICIFPTITNAVSVPVNYTNYWYYHGATFRFYCLRDQVTRTIFHMTLNKQFDLTASGVKILDQDERTIIPTGVSLIATNHNVTGSYSYASADYGTPPMDDQIYNWNYRDWCFFVFGVENQMRGGISSQVGYNLTSSNNNIIDCSAGNSCITRNNGTATVTVNFPGSGSYYVQRSYQWGQYHRENQNYRISGRRCSGPRGAYCYPVYTCNDPSHRLVTRTDHRGANLQYYCVNDGLTAFGGGSVTGAWGYSLSPISYTMTVRRPNSAPTVNYTNTTEIEYNTARANWSYSDPEGDVQTYAQVQVATDTGFNNIVFSNVQAGAATNMTISGLRPSTTYYPRVKVWNNENGDSQWANGPAFRTKVNNPPNLDQLSCSATSGVTDYERAKLEWNYTGTDEPGDELVLKARWKRPEDGVWTVVGLPYNTRKGDQDIIGLISGYAHDIQVSLNDNRNIHLGDRWKGCGTVTPPNYPLPQVSFDLKSGTKTASIGGILTIETGDTVNANWSITDTIGVIDNSCRLITTNTSGGVAADIFGSTTNRGFSGNNLVGQNLPVSLTDQTYKIELKCDGKNAKTKRNISESITLVVESYPIITSCSVDGNSTVQAGQTNVNITAQVRNVIGYNWEAGVNNNNRDQNKQTGSKSGNPNPDTLTIPLTYNGTEFGRYTPWLKVTRSGTTRSDERTCGTVANLGDSNVREVNP